MWLMLVEVFFADLQVLWGMPLDQGKNNRADFDNFAIEICHFAVDMF